VPHSKIESSAKEYSERGVVFRHNRHDLKHIVVEHECDEPAVLANEDRVRSLTSVTIALFTETPSANHINAIAHW
jgi:hypothetical protein